MKAVRVEKQGGPEVLKLLDVAPLEAPGPGQAVVRIAAAGVNYHRRNTGGLVQIKNRPRAATGSSGTSS